MTNIRLIDKITRDFLCIFAIKLFYILGCVDVKRFIKEKNKGTRYSRQRVPLFFKEIKIYAKTSSSDGIAGMAP